MNIFRGQPLFDVNAVKGWGHPSQNPLWEGSHHIGGKQYCKTFRNNPATFKAVEFQLFSEIKDIL